MEFVKIFFIVVPIVISISALIYQIHHQRKEHKREATTLLYNEINTKEFRRALRFIYGRRPEELTIGKLAVEEREEVEMVTAHFDRLGFRIRTGQIYEKDVYHQFRDSVLKAAQQLFAHQTDQRKRRNCGKYEKEYNPDFDWLARRFKIRQLKEKNIKINKNIRKLSMQELLNAEPIPLEAFKQNDV